MKSAEVNESRVPRLAPRSMSSLHDDPMASFRWADLSMATTNFESTIPWRILALQANVISI